MGRIIDIFSMAISGLKGTRPQYGWSRLTLRSGFLVATSAPHRLDAVKCEGLALCIRVRDVFLPV